jgi:kynurenine formamidase
MGAVAGVALALRRGLPRSSSSPMRDLINRLSTLRRFDLAQKWHAGMPHHPSHPPYARSLTKLHGDFLLDNGASSAGDAVSFGTHTGTHIDALCHYSLGGRLHGGGEVARLQNWTDGIAQHGAGTIPLFLQRGVLLDVARVLAQPLNSGDRPLDSGVGIDAELLMRAEDASLMRLECGDIALIRTGWGQYWDQPRQFVNGLHMPGVTLDGAQWLSRRGVAAAGSDTLAFERLPSPRMEVHVHLLVEAGIHILECLALEALSAARVPEFLFVAAPLKLDGATASPLRPYALAE